MAASLTWIRNRLDRIGLSLSVLCAVHCVGTLVLVAGLGIGGSVLLNPAIHRTGLILAMLIVAVAIGAGALRHRRPAPFVIATMGLSFMGAGMAAPRESEEAVLTIIGVSLVAVAHVLNVRHLHRCNLHQS
jgi:drug/metabolite transporter (DMT)-like permease